MKNEAWYVMFPAARGLDTEPHVRHETGELETYDAYEANNGVFQET